MTQEHRMWVFNSIYVKIEQFEAILDQYWLEMGPDMYAQTVTEKSSMEYRFEQMLENPGFAIAQA